jgi:hypothetical protein
VAALMLKQEYLKDILNYNPNTGRWYWKVNRNRNLIGEWAGHLQKNSHNPRGFWKICIDRKLYAASRLAFLYMIGRFPEPCATHISLDTSDDRWENLKEGRNKNHRWANKKPCNLRVASLTKKRNLPMGVFPSDSGKRFKAVANMHGKYMRLGYFATPEEASRAYQEYVIANDRWCAMLASYT